MDKKNRVRRFFLPLITIGLLAALFLLLPLIPLPGLKDRLENEFSATLQRPCQIMEVRLKLLPCPAISAQGVTCSAPDFALRARSLDLEFSLLSLISFSPLIDSIHLQGVLAEIPFATLFPDDGFEEEFLCLSPGCLGTFFRGEEQGSTSFSLDDAICKVTKVPGFNKPLLFTALKGRWRSHPQSQSENLELDGSVNGGQGHLQVTWYKVEDSSAPDGDSLGAGARIEVSCRLQGVTLPESEEFFWGSHEKRWRVGFTQADLEFDINGDPGAGLRFSTSVAVADHHLSRHGIDGNRDSDRLYSQGALQANFAGFFQPSEGYLNIKSASFKYPEAATLFSRGLVRFREPFFVDLVNHLKVDDLAKVLEHCPLPQLSGYQCLGQLEADLKLIGNPLQAPILQLKLNSEKIILQALEVAVDDRLRSLDYQEVAVFFLRSLAKWEWVVKSDCRISLLELPELDLAEVIFLAEKNLVQFEIERLVAHFGQQGQVRLSLIMDDFLNEPRWQASFVIKKFDLKPFRKNLSLTGILDASLVGGGRLEIDSEMGKDLVFNGKWQLRQGRFVESQLFAAFNRFLVQKKGLCEPAKFSNFSGKFALRDKILRLDNLKIGSPGNQLNARGRFFAVGERLDFRGRLNRKNASLLPFRLSGELKNPIFTAD